MTTIPSTDTPVHIGIDVAKSSLQVDLPTGSATFPNTPKGHQKLASRLPGGAFIVMEATGSYHLALLDFLHAGGIPVAAVNPARAKAFARAMGLMAKTDPLDASMLSAYGRALRPTASTPREADRVKLRELVALRDHLLGEITALGNRLEHGQCGEVSKLTSHLVRKAKASLVMVEKAIASLLAGSPVFSAHARVIQGCKGVGPVTAAVLLSEMPELGRMNRKEAAALAGLAPFANDSGQASGRRSVRAGRPRVKRALYLASLSAVRHHPQLKATYKHLKAQGKPSKVALIAVARKLLSQLNALLREHIQTSEK